MTGDVTQIALPRGQGSGLIEVREILKDVPDIEVILIEEPQPRAPYGIKGVGEAGAIASTPAVVNAVFTEAARRLLRSRLPSAVPVASVWPSIVMDQDGLPFSAARI